MNTKKWSWLSSPVICGIGVFAVGLFVLNELAPLMSDDYIYSFAIDSQEGFDSSCTHRVGSWYDLFASNVNHYQHVNGRFVAHVIAQLFLWMGKGWGWSLLNTLCVMLNAWLIFHLVCPRESYPNRAGGYLLTLALYWLLLPVPGQTVFWLTGSCNYQWMAFLLLAFLYLWTKPESRIAMWLAMPIALLAGNGQEGISAGLAVGLCMFSIFNYRTLSGAQKLAVLLFLLGVLTNIKSPGNTYRMATCGLDAPFFHEVAYRLVQGSRSVLQHMEVFGSSFALLSLGVIYACWKKRLYMPFYIPMAAVMSLGALVYAMAAAPRVVFGVYLFAFMVALPALLHVVFMQRPMWRLLVSALLALTVLGSGVRAGYLLHENSFIHHNIMVELQEKGRVELDHYPFHHSRYTHRMILPMNDGRLYDFSNLQRRACAAYYKLPEGVRVDLLPSDEAWGDWSGVMWEKSLLSKVQGTLEPGEYQFIDEQMVILRFPEEMLRAEIYGHVNRGAALSLWHRWKYYVHNWKEVGRPSGMMANKDVMYAYIEVSPFTEKVVLQGRTSMKDKQVWSFVPAQKSGFLECENTP